MSFNFGSCLGCYCFCISRISDTRGNRPPTTMSSASVSLVREPRHHPYDITSLRYTPEISADRCGQLALTGLRFNPFLAPFAWHRHYAGLWCFWLSRVRVDREFVITLPEGQIFLCRNSILAVGPKAAAGVAMPISAPGLSTGSNNASSYIGIATYLLWSRRKY